MERTGGGSRVWSVVLAGGEGERIRPFISRWLGEHKPKQYCTFVGTRSMFQHTLDRAGQVSSPDRVVTVIARGHEREAGAQLDGRRGGVVLVQPQNRDTAAGVLLPLTYIRACDPQATVVIHPSDHFVYPEEQFLALVERAVLTAMWLTDRLVLLGATPEHAEPDYGWILPGRTLAWSSGCRVREVVRFVEKPDGQQAGRAMHAGGLWNTLVLAVRVDRLWRLAWQCFPDLMPLFQRLSRAIGTPAEATVLDAIYRGMPKRNFSAGLLQHVSEQAVVIEMGDLLWSDWGRAERIAQTLERIDRRPAFPVECLEDLLRGAPNS